MRDQLDPAAPVLFLDIDGVANTRATMAGKHGLDFTPDMLEPALIARVATVVRRTGCNVILSSGWRLGGSYNAVRRALYHHHGDPFRIVDRTPNVAPRPDRLFFGAERGAEIAAWLDEHPSTAQFAIVDDNDDMGPLRPQLVLTDPAVGIQDGDVERLVVLLGERG